MPRVSVLIPVYNGQSILSRAVGSALEQTFSEIEVIVVDDASQDGTFALAERLAVADPRIRVLTNRENGGPGAARALGLRHALGDWIAILDADDEWEPDRLARLISVAEKGCFDAVADNLALIDPGLDHCVGHAFPLEADAVELITLERFLANAIPGGRVNLGWMQPIVRRGFLVEHGIAWRPLRHAEDMVFAMDVLLAGARFGLLGWAGYRYTQRRGTVSRRASRNSRTRRDAAEQQKAIALIRETLGDRETPALCRRLSMMHDEVAATTYVLDARDAFHEGAWQSAGVKALMALRYPRALVRCGAARYGQRAHRVV
jgi:glycosyltransferase involved in cell wall biosynthesis